MNRQASQESLMVLGAAAVSIIGPVVAAAIKQKLADNAASKVIESTKDALRAGKKDLVSNTQSARVEPILLMDQRALAVPFIQDVVHSCYNLFTGYWLLSVSLDTTINGVSVGRRLDKFATDRDLNDATLNYLGSAVGMESMDIGLPFAQEILKANFESLQASLEADSITNDVVFDQDKKKDDKKDPVIAGTRVGDANKAVTQLTNLAVGQMVEVTISEDGKEARVPVMIRLRVAGMPAKTLVETMAVGGVDMTTRGRWRAWRAGELRFWADFVMAMDRVDAHRAASMNDETGYYKTVYNRAAKNGLAEILSDGPSLATASSIIVLTEDTARDLEAKVGGKLSSFRVRQGIFGMTYSMLMAVVDPEWESVTIYTRGIDMPTKLHARDMKAAGKSDSKELMDILKSYQLGRAPGRP